MPCPNGPNDSKWAKSCWLSCGGPGRKTSVVPSRAMLCRAWAGLCMARYYACHDGLVRWAGVATQAQHDESCCAGKDHLTVGSCHAWARETISCLGLARQARPIWSPLTGKEPQTETHTESPQAPSLMVQHQNTTSATTYCHPPGTPGGAPHPAYK